MKTNFHSKWAWLSKVVGVVAGISALVLVAPAAQAQVLITASYNQVGADFFYNFQVENQGLEDVTAISALFTTQEPTLVITGESAPSDFIFDYDSGSLDFIEGIVNGFGAGTTVNGFTLTSNELLVPDSLTGFDTNNAPVTVTFSSVAATVPEPGTLPLVALAVSAFAGTVIVRRRRVA